MTMLAETVDAVIGIDTHRDNHEVEIADAAGRPIATMRIETVLRPHVSGLSVDDNRDANRPSASGITVTDRSPNRTLAVIRPDVGAHLPSGPSPVPSSAGADSSADPSVRLLGPLTGRLVAMDINCVIVDSADPDRLTAFWSELLDRPVVARFGPYVWLERRNGLGVGFQRTDGSKVGKNRLHLDLESEDPAAEQARVEALGGLRLTEYDPGGFFAIVDPDGNELCVIPEGLFELDDEGRADYLTGDAEAT